MDRQIDTTRRGRIVRTPKKLDDYETGFVVSLNSESTLSYAEAS